MNPIIYAVNIMVDGIGDLGHFLDFIAAAAQNPANMQNAHFVICTNRELGDDEHRDSNLRIHAIVTDFFDQLPENHPLKHLRDKVIFIAEGQMEEKAQELRASLGENQKFCVYFTSMENEDLIEAIDPHKSTWHFIAYLEEHNNDDRFVDSNRMRPFYNCLSLSPKGAGIFIPESLIDKPLEPNSIILTENDISADDAVTICYAHVYQDVLINLIAAFNELYERTMIIFAIKPLKATEYNNVHDEELEEANCTLLTPARDNWIDDRDFRLLKIKQAQTAHVGAASGDKGTEYCIGNGLLPIIEYKNGKKENFWESFIETLESDAFNSILTSVQQASINRIIDYLRASCEYWSAVLQMDLMELIEVPDVDGSDPLENLFETAREISAADIEVWRDIVCPYLRQHFDIAQKIPRNVEVFRMCAALVQSDGEEFTTARNFFQSMPADEYERFASFLLEEVITYMHQSPDTNETISLTNSAFVLLALQHVRNWDQYLPKMLNEDTGLLRQEDIISFCRNIISSEMLTTSHGSSRSMSP